MTALVDDADFERLMIDVSYVKVHPDAAGAKGGNQEMGLNTKIHLAVDARGMPVRFFVTDATVADCSIAEKLIAEFQAEYLLADRGYDTDAIIQHALQAGMTPVIPPKKNRKVLRNYSQTT